MFSLFDVPAYMLWSIGSLFQGVAKCIASQAFIRWKTGEAPRLTVHRQIEAINLKLGKVTEIHYRLYKEPLQFCLVCSRSGYCLYVGAVCLITGTLQDCSNYIDAIIWHLHTRLGKE